MKLISMTDFVFLMRENKEKDNIRRFWACETYAKFLKQPLTIGQFVPCDLEGNVLEEPPFLNSDNDIQNDCQLWEEAQSRVLFEGFECVEMFKRDKVITFQGIINIFYWKYEFQNWQLSKGIFTIEDFVKYNLQLTQTAINQLKL